MFFNENCPLRMDKEAVNRAQLKTQRKSTMSCVESKPNETMCVRKNVQIGCTRWKCPPKFAMNSDWGVAEADESEELKAQNHREARVLEEIYPCPSAIPLNPSVATDAYDGHLDDALVPSIPLIPIEEEEEEEAYIAAPLEASVAALPEASMAAPPEASVAALPEASMAEPSEASMELQTLDLPQATLEPEYRDSPLNDLPANVKPDITIKPSVEADAAAAAAAAYTAILKCKELGSLVDSDLLISILSNPELIKKLIVEHGFSEDVLKKPATMLKDVASPTLDRGFKKSCDVGEPSSSGSRPLSRLKMVTGTNEPSLPTDHVGVVAPFSWTPSAPFRRSTSDEMMINKLSGSTDSEVKPVVQSTSLLNLKPDVLECRRLISQFGYDKQGEPVVVSDPKTTGPSPRPDILKACLHLVPSIDHNAPSMALSAETCPTSRPKIPNSSLNMVPMTVTVGTGLSLRPRFPSSSLPLGPVQNAFPNGPLMAMTAATGPSPRPDISKSSFHCVPPQSVHPNVPSVAVTARACTSPRPKITILPSVSHNVPQCTPSMVAGTGLSQRPHFPNPSLQLGPIQNACQNAPPNSSFHCVPEQVVHPNAPVAMAARTGTSPRPNISSLHSAPHNVYQGSPSVTMTASSTKNMDYFKSLIRNHGNGQETPKIDHVEVHKSLNNQQGPLTYIVQQPTFEKPHCKYFSMPRGCRNGVNCQFKHVAENLPNTDRLFQEAPDSKRVKFCGEFGTKK